MTLLKYEYIGCMNIWFVCLHVCLVFVKAKTLECTLRDTHLYFYQTITSLSSFKRDIYMYVLCCYFSTIDISVQKASNLNMLKFNQREIILHLITHPFVWIEWNFSILFINSNLQAKNVKALRCIVSKWQKYIQLN